MAALRGGRRICVRSVSLGSGGFRWRGEVGQGDPLFEGEFFGPRSFLDGEMGAEGRPVELLVGEVFAELFPALGEALFNEPGEAWAVAEGDLAGRPRSEEDDGRIDLRRRHEDAGR